MTTTLTSGILAVSDPSENPRRIVVMKNRTTAPKVLEAAISEIVRTNGKILEEHLGEMVRSTVEDILNGLLDAESVSSGTSFPKQSGSGALSTSNATC